MNVQSLTFDIKRLYREPILILFMCVPFIAFIAIKLLIVFGLPIILNMTGFDLDPYFGYVESFCILLSPGMLGTVAAFLMIDERDERIYDLMSITPIGYTGYISNRLLMPFILSAVYTFLAHFILNIYSVSFLKLFIAACFSGIQSIVLGLLLFSLADDKVKGLTYTKGFNGLMATSIADLLGVKWVSLFSSLVPYYWTSYIITKPLSLLSLTSALAVHIGWLAISIFILIKHR